MKNYGITLTRGNNKTSGRQSDLSNLILKKVICRKDEIARLTFPLHLQLRVLKRNEIRV